jgi:hypothetical protein
MRGPGGKGGNAKVAGHNSSARGGDGGEGAIGPGGPGGNAEVQGDNSHATGGKGGRGGLGPGGPGGGASARGDGITYAGGEGGEANQPDGRGGRGGRSGYFTLGLPDFQLPDGRWISEFGRGGDGAHTAQYAARLSIVEDIVGHTITAQAESAGVCGLEADQALDNINLRVAQDGHAWRVRVRAGCFEFYDM